MLLLMPFLLMVQSSLGFSQSHLQKESEHISGPITAQPIRVTVSHACAKDGDKNKEILLDNDSPLVLTQRIHLAVAPGSGCGHDGIDLAALRERIKSLETEVSVLQAKCGGQDGCCLSQQSKGAVCITGCPDDCNDQGRCVDGKCVCFSGFSGLDCSRADCPSDCSSRGRCVDGQCVCHHGFSGPDCGTLTCPSNCSNRGRCVDGKCVCDSGLAGPDCAEDSCPGNCNGRGRCVNGICVCDVGFSGPDCLASACPNNCNNRGRCVNGKCACGRGFSGPDCGRCQSGFTGDNCDTALTGPSRLGTKNITDSSVTLFWTPPPVLYDAYNITFTGMKEPDQMIHSRIKGRLSSYTQTGLAAGQKYMVGITGEKEGVSGKESLTEFTTLISGPNNLHVVKTSTSMAVVKWEKARGEIDRYVLSVAPNQKDGSSRSREINLPPERDSAQIDFLQAGRLYDLSLVAVKDSGRSLPATAQTTPGPEPPSNLAVRDVTESSFIISWTKPKSRVSGFVVTCSHLQEGGPVTLSVDEETDKLVLPKLSTGSTYEVSVVSVLGQDQSDSVKTFATTLPDSPTDLRTINITDSKALLLWRPALAALDHYLIQYKADAAPGSGISVKVSGNTVEHQLQGLQASTVYTATVQSLLGDLSSSAASATFTTTAGAEKRPDGPQDLKASQVTPRSAVLSWKPPASAISSYKLSYSIEGRDMKEVVVGPTLKEFKLSRLFPMSTYTVHLQAEQNGRYTTIISTVFTTGHLRFPFPTDCSQERLNGVLESGIVDVFPLGREGKPVMVYCDMETDGGGWTVFQRRKDGQTDFFRGWREYSNGFGKLDGEFWLGNDLLHNFTVMGPMMLRVDLRSGDQQVHAGYSSFSVDSQKKHYSIRVSGYTGTAGDSMTYHNGRPFSTRDRDPRPFITRCAMSYRGGWWYKNCHEANLNGLYATNSNHQGVIWTTWKGKDFSIPFTEMKFRPSSFKP